MGTTKPEGTPGNPHRSGSSAKEIFERLPAITTRILQTPSSWLVRVPQRIAGSRSPPESGSGEEIVDLFLGDHHPNPAKTLLTSRIGARVPDRDLWGFPGVVEQKVDLGQHHTHDETEVGPNVQRRHIPPTPTATRPVPSPTASHRHHSAMGADAPTARRPHHRRHRRLLPPRNHRAEPDRRRAHRVAPERRRRRLNRAAVGVRPDRVWNSELHRSGVKDTLRVAPTDSGRRSATHSQPSTHHPPIGGNGNRRVPLAHIGRCVTEVAPRSTPAIGGSAVVTTDGTTTTRLPFHIAQRAPRERNQRSTLSDR